MKDEGRGKIKTRTRGYEISQDSHTPCKTGGVCSLAQKGELASFELIPTHILAMVKIKEATEIGIGNTKRE